MSLMVSYNIAVKQKFPTFFENVDIVRINTPWYSIDELKKIFSTVKKPKFVDINLKERNKDKKTDHEYTSLLKLCGEYNVEWIAISNVETAIFFDNIRKLLGNKTTKICAKIETNVGCNNIDRIIDAFDGIMVDVEDLAFEIGWQDASQKKKEIYELCIRKRKPHFVLSGVIFEYIKPEIIVYTYGAWDLLHPGHINMLEKAKSYGDKLIVGVVGDEAIRKLKGEDRPIQTQEDRLRNVSSLRCVDLAVTQIDYDPIPNLKRLKPFILVKGDDWDYIPGEEFMNNSGGFLVKPPYSKGWSTSSIIKKIRGELNQ